ncbi:hypothetical protein [Pseudomonas juntendi]|uniref:hypothetical protein n=1 Tax=Pseudomonas juntendi TaxID=2666183 RepID=UPI001FFDD398|nr:hypothetical protein [Pseudomonas juntendi]MCK2109200.1 hypothetical protein [Pseudomonas juntendi]MCK2118116.1 hypothetical protein [Pseudomonas juntendi]
MDTNKMREQFEAAYAAKSTARNGRFYPGVLTRGDDGDYVIPSVQSAWWAWQASREAVVVELGAPSHWVADYAACGGGMTVFDAEKAAKVTDPMCSKTPSYTIHALEKAGLKVAP